MIKMDYSSSPPIKTHVRHTCNTCEFSAEESKDMFRLAMATILLGVSSSILASQANMAISSPSGGESYVIGQPETIIYSGKTRFKTILVELSRDGGTTWTTTGT